MREFRDIATRVEDLVRQHQNYRAGSLNLGCAEMLTSPLVREMLATDAARRYGTKGGYSGGGFLDEIEGLGERLAIRLFGAKYAVLSPVTGHVAVMTTLLAFTRPGQKVMALAQEDGGYPMGIATRFGLSVAPLAFDYGAMTLDVERSINRILAERPRLVWLGAPRYLFPHPVRQLRAVCDEVGALLVYDASHPFGLIAGGDSTIPSRKALT